MTDAEKLAMLKTLLGITDTASDALLTVYLKAAESEILAWRYSYATKSAPVVVPTEYEMTQVFAVMSGFSQSGAENQVAHSENGISRTFKYADMIAYIRANVIPVAGWT